MNATPKTIQIFLPAGDPRGIRIAEITTRIVQVIEVPRILLPDFFRMDLPNFFKMEDGHVALYFLFGETGADEQPRVYIGQTGDLRTRLRDHQKKDFWKTVLVLISRTRSLTQTHALFLEWYSLQAARAAGRYDDENENGGSRPHTPAPLEADCLEIFETGRTLLATLGYPLFDPLVTLGASSKADEIFVLTAAGANGRGIDTIDGFVVLKGSTGRRANVPSIVGTSDERFRQRLVEAGVMREEGDLVVFQRDHLFGSPSMAGTALLGRTCNGWKDWKGQDGRSLGEIKRAQPDDAP